MLRLCWSAPQQTSRYGPSGGYVKKLSDAIKQGLFAAGFYQIADRTNFGYHLALIPQRVPSQRRLEGNGSSFSAHTD
jgi:hypothetical protein